jgi:hypothetical protein
MAGQCGGQPESGGDRGRGNRNALENNGRAKILSGPFAPPLFRSFPQSRYFFFLLFFCLTGCPRPNPGPERRSAVDEFFVRAQSCLPANEPGEAPGEGSHLAIESVTADADATQIRLIAYALGAPVDFYAPIYRLSAGRWLIHEKGRAYLLDDKCREWKLRDKKAQPGGDAGSLSKSAAKNAAGQMGAQDGRVRLIPGQVFTTTLIFPPLPEQTQVGALVYDGRILPFTLYTKSKQR